MKPNLLDSYTEKARSFENFIESLPSGKLINSKLVSERIKIDLKTSRRYLKQTKEKGAISLFQKKPMLHGGFFEYIYVKK